MVIFSKTNNSDSFANNGHLAMAACDGGGYSGWTEIGQTRVRHPNSM